MNGVDAAAPPPAVPDVGAPLRAMHILTRMNIGGPARMALDADERLRALGVETILVSGLVQDGEADLADETGFSGVVRVPRLGRRPSASDDAQALRDLYRVIVRRRPHLVHTHMGKAGTLGRLAAAAAAVPLRVHTFHGHTLHGYFSPAATRTVVATERMLARMTTTLVAVSRRVREDLLRQGVGRPDRFRVIEVGLALEPFLRLGRDQRLRRALGIPAGAPVIGLAGRLVPVKGVDLFLEAVRSLLARREDLHVLVAGGGPELSRVDHARRTFPGGDRVHALGWLTDVTPFYEALDALVLSSRNEGLPLTVIEASAAGIPVVATRVGGIPEIVDDGRTGLLVPSGDAVALAAAVSRVLEDGDLRARMRDAARETARRFSAERYARDLAALYADLAEARRRAARRTRPVGRRGR